MRFSIAAVLAFAATGLCQVPGFNVITKPEKAEQVPAGSTYKIVWQPSADQPGDIKIGLLGGATPGSLDIIDTIATGVDPSTGSYSWAVPSELGDLATYGIVITLESDKDVFQFGFPFQIVGGGDDSDDEEDSTSATATPTTTADATTTETEASTTTTSSGDDSDDEESTSTVTSVSSTVTGNASITGNPQTTITSVVVSDGTTPTTSATSTLVTNAAGSVAAGSFAMLGGVAMAVLAL
jgi:hypothetical protein